MTESATQDKDPVKARMANIAYTLTQPIETGEHKENLFGLRPPPPKNPASTQASPATSKDIFLTTVLALPKHFIVQLLRTIQPLIAMLLSLGIGAFACSMILQAAVVDRGCATELYASLYFDSTSLWKVALANLSFHTANICWAFMFYVAFFFMWDWRVSFPWILRCVVLVVSLNLYQVVSMVFMPLGFSNDFIFEPLWPMLVWLSSLLMVVATPYNLYHIKWTLVALKLVHNPVWAWMYSMYCMSMLVLGIFMAVCLRYLMGMSDGLKLAFVILVNVPLMELLSVMSRFTARSVRHNHPSTSWIPICLGVVFKKLWMRFVVGSMKSSSLVTVASIMAGMTEILARFTMPKRDKFLYQKLFGPHLPLDKQATALMTNARNKSLRAETETLEGISDMVFIIMGIVWPRWYGASLNGETLPDMEQAVLKALIQWGLESALDVVICLLLAVVQNYHILAHGKVKCRYWSTVVALVIFFVTLMPSVQAMGYMLCTNPEIPAGIDWVFCSTLYS